MRTHEIHWPVTGKVVIHISILGILYDIANSIWKSQCHQYRVTPFTPSLYIHTCVYVLYYIMCNILYNIWYIKASTAVGFYTQSSNVNLPILLPPLIPSLHTIFVPFCSIITLYPFFLSVLFSSFLKSYTPHSCLQVSRLLCVI